jgi:hypothetical protein
VVGWSAVAWGSSDGRSGATERGCQPCHGSRASDEVGLTIVAPPASPGEQVTLTVSVDHPSAVAAGFNVGVSGGALGVVDGARAAGDELVHAAPLALPLRLELPWTAPDAEGEVEVQVAVNAVDGDGSALGDAWAVASATARVEVPAPDEAPEPTGGCASAPGGPGWALALAAAVVSGRWSSLRDRRGRR